MWQYYLPRLSFQKQFGGLPDYPVYDVWLKGGWAAFGWLEIEFPQSVYCLLSLLTLAVLVGAAVARRAGMAANRLAPLAAFFALRGEHCWRACTGPSSARWWAVRGRSTRVATCCR